MIARTKLVIVLGGLVILVPLIGMPRNVRDVVLLIFGSVLIALGISLGRGVRTLRLKLKRLEGQQGTFIS